MIKKLTGFLLLIVSSAHVFAQELQDSLLTELKTRFTQEKIHLHTDKSFYNYGETLWFKAYLFTDNLPSKISTTVYAELIDEQGAILQRKTMPVLQSGAASHFDLPDSTIKSKLYIRTYTAWMLNFDSTLMLVKPVNMLASSGNKINPAYTLSFFPEGGDLVDNVECRLAFKTNDQDGKPFAVAGSIRNAQGVEVAKFKSTHQGMGMFSITVEAGQKYTASWKDPTGKDHETVLPNAKRRSAALRVNHSAGNLSYSITRPADAIDDYKEFTVLAQMHQQTTYAARINLRNKTTVTAPIPIDSLPDGILQLTIFNRAQEPVAERVVFINNNTYSFFTDLHLVSKNTQPREKNVLQVDVGGRLNSNLSISVTDADLDVRQGPQENIYSRLLLSSDLKGSIYNPAYYFASEEDSVKQQLDLVMMSNGWRRFNWQDLMSKKLPVIKEQPGSYLSIKGNVFGLSAMQLNDKMLTGFVQTSEKAANSFLNIPVNKDGSFLLSNVYFFDTVKLFYQFNNDKNKSLTNQGSFAFNNGLVRPPVVPLGLLQKEFFAPALSQDLLNKNIKQHLKYLSAAQEQKIKVLETVTVTGKRISPEEQLDKEYASGLFTSGNSRIFDIENDPFGRTAISVLDFLRSRVPGLQVSTDGPEGGSVSRRGSETEVFLNEMNTEISVLQSTSMSDVAMIKVFDPPFFGSAGGGPGGAVAVYTKKGASRAANVQGLNTATLQGYSAIKEFYMPNYETPGPQEALADLRTTLYWNPFILMDAKTRRVTLPFFNNMSAKKFRVIIEGINEAGQLTREEKIFE